MQAWWDSQALTWHLPCDGGRSSFSRESGEILQVKGRDANNTKSCVHLSSHLPLAVFLHLELKGGYENIMLKGLTVQTETSRSY